MQLLSAFYGKYNWKGERNPKKHFSMESNNSQNTTYNSHNKDDILVKAWGKVKEEEGKGGGRGKWRTSVILSTIK